MDLKKILEGDLFRPESFLVFYLIFVLITIASFFTNLPLKKPSLLSFAVIFLTFPSFLFGIKIGKVFYGKKIPEAAILVFTILIAIFYTFVLANFYKWNFYYWLIVIFAAFFVFYAIIKKHPEIFLSRWKTPLGLMAIGVVFLAISFFQAGGIPLLNPALKFNLIYNIPFGLSVLSFVFGFIFIAQQTKHEKLFWPLLILGTILFLLSALRGNVLVIFLAGAFIAYYTKKFGNKKIFLALAAAFLIIIFVGYSVRPILNPAELLLFRAGTTHTVFDNVVQKSMPFGYTDGALFFKGDPRAFVGHEIMGKDANLTYTILGQAFLDFGILGAIVWMFILGLILQLAHSNMREQGFLGFYPLLFAVSLVLIEIGLDQFYLAYFVIFLLFYLMKNKADHFL